MQAHVKELNFPLDVTYRAALEKTVELRCNSLF
jgi:hypothetical protein